MKLITFSLWGEEPKYCVGAIKNAELAQEIYPDWICRFYIADTVPIKTIKALKQLPNTELAYRHEEGNWSSMFWRFEPAGKSNVDVMISRDTDSRLNYREKAAVDEWMESDKGFHIMRDHPYHRFPVLGGMWGSKKGCIPHMKNLIENWTHENAYGNDYYFFAEKIIPFIEENVIVHDEFFEKKPFPTDRNDLEFVGQVFDEEDHTVEEHVEALASALNKYGYIKK